MNGIPWWYFYKERGPLDGHHLESVDPANPTAPPRTASWPCAMLEIGGLFGIIGAVGVLFASIA